MLFAVCWRIVVMADMPRRGGFRHAYSIEKLREFRAVPAEEKLRWLEEMRCFLEPALTPEKIAIIQGFRDWQGGPAGLRGGFDRLAACLAGDPSLQAPAGELAATIAGSHAVPDAPGPAGAPVPWLLLAAAAIGCAAIATSWRRPRRAI